jgi:hypothetical protein
MSGKVIFITVKLKSPINEREKLGGLSNQMF